MAEKADRVEPKGVLSPQKGYRGKARSNDVVVEEHQASRLGKVKGESAEGRGQPLVSGEIVMADMTFFVVSEERLDHLTEQNDDASAYRAFAAALASFGAGIIVAAVYADHLSSFAQVATFMLAPLCFIGAAFCFIRGQSHQRSAGGTLTRIKANRARVNFKSYVEQDKEAEP